MILLLTTPNCHGHHVRQIRPILVDGHAVLLLRICVIDNVVRVLAGTYGYGYATQRECYRSRFLDSMLALVGGGEGVRSGCSFRVAGAIVAVPRFVGVECAG